MCLSLKVKFSIKLRTASKVHCFGQFSVLPEVWLDCVDEYQGESDNWSLCGLNSQSYRSCDPWGQIFLQYLPSVDLDTQSRFLPEMLRPYNQNHHQKLNQPLLELSAPLC